MRPISNYTSDEAEQMKMPFRPSSRIEALVNKSSKSIGASCNVYLVEDDLNDIAFSQAWGTSVLGYQGAPSWDVSKLRPINTPLGSKGTASGAVSFARVYDSIVGEMRREEKKNGAGIVGLDYKHPELERFLNEPLKHAYKMVYLPMHDTSEATDLLKNNALLSLLSEAYDQFKTFLVKRPLPLADGTELGVNLCTEVEIPTKGFCNLGALNLSYFTPKNIHFLPAFFKLAMTKMVDYERKCREAAITTHFLSCPSPANRQVGLGIYGLSSVLGAWGNTYEEFNEALKFYGVDYLEGIEEILALVVTQNSKKTLAQTFASYLIQAYFEASTIAADAGLRAAFCIQPTVSTSQRSLDAFGYNVSPEVQPVDGIKHEGGVNYIRKSAIKGDSVQVCHPYTWTLDEVSYETYAETSALLQQLMESTGLAHRHSHCFYGERFTTQDLRNFYTGATRHRKSLYYRLPFSNNTSSLRKDSLWQEVDSGELFDGDLETLLSGCNLQKKGELDCDCQM